MNAEKCSGTFPCPNFVAYATKLGSSRHIHHATGRDVALRRPLANADLQNQHAVAVTIKSVSLADRLPIRAKNKLAPGKCTYEHKQGRARQMKICQQRI